MSQPPLPGGSPAPSSGPVGAAAPSGHDGTPGGWWSPDPAVSWPPPWSPPAPPAVPARKSAGRWVLALVALAGVVAGAVGASFLVTAVFVASAEDIGREMGTAMGESSVDAMEGLMEDYLGGTMPEDMWSSPYGPVEQSEPVAPVAGPDPVLDAYAQSCFEGDLQACDDLYYESPPMSEYEEYGGTCGGRVKMGMVMYCTELE